MASGNASTILPERSPTSRPLFLDPEEERKNKEVTLRKRPTTIREFTDPLEIRRRETYRPLNPLPDNVNAKWSEGHSKSGKSTSTDNKAKHIDETPIDVHSTGKDVSIHLNIDVQIDITEDVTELSRLNRLGRFKEGIQLFEQKLKNHIDFFPVAAEYTDLLLQQGSYGAASSFVFECLSTQEKSKDSATKFEYEHEEKLLLKSIKALADIFSQGHLEQALKVALDISTTLERIENKGLSIHLIESYMRIISFAELNSSFLYREEFWELTALSSLYPNERLKGAIFPLTRYSCKQLGNWYYHLRQQGFYWETHRFLQIVLAMLEHTHTLRYSSESRGDSLSALFVSFMRIRRLDVLDSSFIDIEHVLSHGDEQLILTEFANASLIGNFLAASVTWCGEHLKAARACLSRARELVKVILNKYPALSSSRPFLEWMLTEKSRTERIIQGPSVPVKPFTNTSFRGGPDMIFSFRRYIAARTIDTKMSTVQKSKEHDAASLWKILSSAEKLGDFLLQRSVLQQIIQSWPISGSDSNSTCERLGTCEKLADLALNTMNDLPSYIECRSEQYAQIDSLPLSDDQVKAKMKLCEEIQHFDRLYPSDNDMTKAARKRLSHPLFQIHVSDVLRKCVHSQLLRDLHRKKEALIVEAKLHHIEDDAPGFTKDRRDFLMGRHYFTDDGRRKMRGIYSPPSSSSSSDSVTKRRRSRRDYVLNIGDSRVRDHLRDSEMEYEDVRYGALKASDSIRRAKTWDEDRYTRERRRKQRIMDLRDGKSEFGSIQIDKKAVIELGYPFIEDIDGYITIKKALSTEQIEEVLLLSEAMEKDAQPIVRPLITHQSSLNTFNKRPERTYGRFIETEDEEIESGNERSSTDLIIERKAAFATQTGEREYHGLVTDEPGAKNRESPRSRSYLRSLDRRPLPPAELCGEVKYEALGRELRALPPAEEEGLKDERPKDPPEAMNEDTEPPQPLKRQATVELDGDGSSEGKD